MKTRYMLYTWPASQAFIGRPDCHLVLPPEDDVEGRLDSAYMVSEHIIDLVVGDIVAEGCEPPLPQESTCFEMVPGSTEGDYLDYNGNAFVAVKEG